MATIRFTDQDRDAHGFVKASAPPQEPRSLADLLPRPAEIKQDARRHSWTRAELAGLAVAALCAAFVLIYAWATPPAPPAPSQPRATPGSTAQPTAAATAAPATPVRLLAAFASPDGLTLGTIEATRPYTVTAHYGDAWVQADVQGSGLIWLRAADLSGVAIVGPDLAPPTIAPLAPFIPETATTAPAPSSCAEAGIAGKMVQVCGDDTLERLQAQAKAKWIEQYGGNIGVISTPSPQIRSTP
jgi:hypothetical protein